VSETQTPPELTSETPRSGFSHTSIVYFHGMGTPKRYEELTRVLDTLDRYAYEQADPRGIGQLRGQVVKLEPSRDGSDEPVAFVRFFRLLRLNNGQQRRVGAFRLYESFWSPAAAGGISAWHVLLWIFVRAFNPIAVLAQSWRSHQRLKLTFLSRLAFDQRRTPTDQYRLLQRHYRAFEGMDARRRYPKGSFEDYLALLTLAEPEKADDLHRLARAWRNALRRSQWEVLLVGFLASLLVVALGTLALGSAIRLLLLGGVQDGVFGPLAERALALPLWILAICAVLLPVATWFGRAFFQNFLSDVVFWTTTFEKDTRHQKRRDILKACEATLRHVLEDPRCDRVVVVGHSLGTAIAYETLLNLGRRSRAEAEIATPGKALLEPLLPKLSHFITFGSPIDRIAYFFNLHYSRYHRFNRVVEELAGTTADPPFRLNKMRNLEWVNIRDAADPVSSRLFAPRSAWPNREEIVEIEVASSHVPDPVGAHVGYFGSRLSAKVLFDACILNRSKVQAQDDRQAESLRFAVLARRLSWTLASLAVCCLFLGAVGFWIADGGLAAASQWAFLALTAGLAVVAWRGRVMDAKHKLTLQA